MELKEIKSENSDWTRLNCTSKVTRRERFEGTKERILCCVCSDAKETTEDTENNNSKLTGIAETLEIGVCATDAEKIVTRES